jgi:hypothetical protein
MNLVYCLALLSLSNALFAWNANGHALISEMTYQYLTPTTKAWVSHYLGPDMTIHQASVWMDQFYQTKFKQMRKLHYINLPYGDEQYFPQLESQNALTAIQYSLSVLNNKNGTYIEKSLALRVLLHVIEDIHQPMHTITWYSKRFSSGDKGGNAWKMYKTNLHQYWDTAGGWLKNFNWKDEAELKTKINEFEVSNCDWQHVDLNPDEWIAQSHELAVKYAYFPPKSKAKLMHYQQTCQGISKQQIQTAACHLAAVLNKISFHGVAFT